MIPTLQWYTFEAASNAGKGLTRMYDFSALPLEFVTNFNFTYRAKPYESASVVYATNTEYLLVVRPEKIYLPLLFYAHLKIKNFAYYNIIMRTLHQFSTQCL